MFFVAATSLGLWSVVLVFSAHTTLFLLYLDEIINIFQIQMMDACMKHQSYD